MANAHYHGEGIGAYPIYDLGRALPEQIQAGLDLSDYIAVIERGDSTFNDKYQAARDLNAKGVIVYNNEDNDQMMTMLYIDNIDRPLVFIKRQDGLKLLDLNHNFGPDFKVSMPSGLTKFLMTRANNLSEFSSWGPTHDLCLKPDLAAPGGGIYSTVSDNDYASMGGTSMATPHIAGIAAIVMQRLYEDGILTGEPGDQRDLNQEYLTQLFLMNTAVPMKNTVENPAWYYTPKEQGAGLVNVHNALKNFVTVTASSSKDQIEDGKLELKEVADEFDFKLSFKNYGDQDQTYSIEYILIKDSVDPETGRFTELSEVSQKTYLGELTVQGHGEQVYQGKVPTYYIDQNQYVQGYFLLKAKNNGEQAGIDLFVPFLGFKGEWDQLPIIDNMIDFDDESKINYLPIEYPNGGIDKTAFVKSNLNNQGWNYWNAWRNGEDKLIFTNSQVSDQFKSEVVPVIAFHTIGRRREH